MDTSQRKIHKKHVKKYSSLVIREIETKSIVSYDYVLTKIKKMKETDNTKCW